MRFTPTILAAVLLSGTAIAAPAPQLNRAFGAALETIGNANRVIQEGKGSGGSSVTYDANGDAYDANGNAVPPGGLRKRQYTRPLPGTRTGGVVDAAFAIGQIIDANNKQNARIVDENGDVNDGFGNAVPPGGLHRRESLETPGPNNRGKIAVEE